MQMAVRALGRTDCSAHFIRGLKCWQEVDIHDAAIHCHVARCDLDRAVSDWSDMSGYDSGETRDPRGRSNLWELRQWCDMDHAIS